MTRGKVDVQQRPQARRFGRWRVGADLLSADGVERALAGAASILKVMNLTQMVILIALTKSSSPRPGLEIAAGLMFAISGVTLITMSFRAHRLQKAAAVVDAMAAVILLLGSPLFQPSGVGRPWSDWPIAVSFLTGAQACVALGGRPAFTVVIAEIAAASSWLAWRLDPATARVVQQSYVQFAGFSICTWLFARYLRSLAALADARGETIRILEEEKSRHRLHTPYRLLNDLTELVRSESVTAGLTARKQALLADAMASVREIEAIVRGTESASSKLSWDLLRLRDQFADLPLVMNIEDTPVDLPPSVVQRVREATRSALQNVRLHAEATEVVVYASTDTDGWIVSVKDNGRGFDPSVTRRGVGLGELIITELKKIGAWVNITSVPGEGTLIEMTGDHAWGKEHSAG